MTLRKLKCPQGCPCLVHALLKFALGYRIGNQSGAAPYEDLAVLLVSDTDRNACIHVARKVDIADGAAVNAALVVLKFTNKLTCPDLGRSGKCSGGKNSVDGIQSVVLLLYLSANSRADMHHV